MKENPSKNYVNYIIAQTKWSTATHTQNEVEKI